MIAYHASTKEFNLFDDARIGSTNRSLQLGPGWYFSTDLQNAEQYGDVVMKFDLPDFGYAERYFEEELSEEQAADVMAELGLENSDVMARSRPEQAAAAMVELHPDKVGLILAAMASHTPYIGVVDTDVICLWNPLMARRLYG